MISCSQMGPRLSRSGSSTFKSQTKLRGRLTAQSSRKRLRARFTHHGTAQRYDTSWASFRQNNQESPRTQRSTRGGRCGRRTQERTFKRSIHVRKRNGRNCAACPAALFDNPNNQKILHLGNTAGAAVRTRRADPDNLSSPFTDPSW